MAQIGSRLSQLSGLNRTGEDNVAFPIIISRIKKMLIFGYRENINKHEVSQALKKHTKLTVSEIKKTISDIEAGNPVNLENDFILREELENLNILIQ